MPSGTSAGPGVGVFAALDRLETHLEDRRYLLGERITEADWRLLPTLLRFDAMAAGTRRYDREPWRAISLGHWLGAFGATAPARIQ